MYKSVFINCLTCGKELTGNQTKYCCRKCHEKDVQNIRKTLNGKIYTYPHIKGTISELYVGIDLLKKNFEVFTNICGTGLCDYLVYKNSMYLLIEVTSGCIKPNNIRCHTKKYIENKWDVLAVYYNDGLIEYIPNNKDPKIIKLFE